MKTRVWDTIRKKWVTDYVIEADGFVMCSPHANFYYEGLHETKVMVSVYIGIKDINNNEVCEGDILKNGDWIGQVVYSPPEYKLHDGKSLFSISFSDFEIIGNIYENTNLELKPH